ncbi:MAG: AAA family ATPase, partial [Candidatus Dormibacteraeota bacterium]|nr:AAA family ATPase [Candidatus Dormibacteraeota bacterium]
MGEMKSELLPVLPLDDVVVLPHMTVPLGVAEEFQAAIDAARQGSHLVLLVPRIDGQFRSLGTVASVQESGKLPTGQEVTIVRGEYRARLGSGQADVGGALWVKAEPIRDADPGDEEQALMREYRAMLENLVESRGAPGVVQFIRAARTPGQLADLAGYSPDLTIDQKVQVLETLDVTERLRLLIGWTRDILADASLKEQIRNDVNEGMEKQQREFLLRQQMDAIRRQLGEGGDDVVGQYRTRIAEAGMPENVRTEVERELDRLERTSEQNPEHGWIRTYLDWMLDIPWNVRSDDNYDLKQARRILDEDHTGLDDVKSRIIEFLAVRKLRHERGLSVLGGRGSGAIITLVGPPGVGKTSLGESVARALGRKFARVSLGGIHDEAEIRGHRRTYIGALPGRIVRALKEAGTKNPVIMLDEIDKVGSDWRGDPSAALLEVLDPAQNNTFRDHYLEVDLDLSEVLFIPTGNVWETIPAPLLDRMELIKLDGYTTDEKLAIARDHLLPRQIAQAGLDPAEISIDDAAITAVITGYTREAGVRNLERELGKVARKVATEFATGELQAPVAVSEELVTKYLGKTKFDNEVAERTAVPGVATGLAVTGVGG